MLLVALFLVVGNALESSQLLRSDRLPNDANKRTWTQYDRDGDGQLSQSELELAARDNVNPQVLLEAEKHQDELIRKKFDEQLQQMDTHTHFRDALSRTPKALVDDTPEKTREDGRARKQMEAQKHLEALWRAQERGRKLSKDAEADGSSFLEEAHKPKTEADEDQEEADEDNERQSEHRSAESEEDKQEKDEDAEKAREKRGDTQEQREVKARMKEQEKEGARVENAERRGKKKMKKKAAPTMNKAALDADAQRDADSDDDSDSDAHSLVEAGIMSEQQPKNAKDEDKEEATEEKERTHEAANAERKRDEEDKNEEKEDQERAREASGDAGETENKSAKATSEDKEEKNEDKERASEATGEAAAEDRNEEQESQERASEARGNNRESEQQVETNHEVTDETEDTDGAKQEGTVQAGETGTQEPNAKAVVKEDQEKASEATGDGTTSTSDSVDAEQQEEGHAKAVNANQKGMEKQDASSDDAHSDSAQLDKAQTKTEALGVYDNDDAHTDDVESGSPEEDTSTDRVDEGIAGKNDAKLDKTTPQEDAEADDQALKKSGNARAFNIYDRNNDGYLNGDEVKELLDENGLTGLPWKQADTDQDRMLSKKEFSDWSTLMNFDQSTDDQARVRSMKGPETMFMLFDKDSDGYLSKNEMSALGKAMGDKLGSSTDPARDDVWKNWDADGDGKLSPEEFVNPPSVVRSKANAEKMKVEANAAKFERGSAAIQSDGDVSVQSKKRIRRHSSDGARDE